MQLQVSALPERVPVGTTYVIVGRNRQDGKLHVFSRYLVFPDGREVELPADRPQSRPAARRARTRKVQDRSKKIFTKRGTRSRASR
jgi:hypothetical protein